MNFSASFSILLILIVEINSHPSTKSKKNKFEVKNRPTGCYGFTVCNSTRNYPENAINKMLKRNKMFQQFVGTISAPVEVLTIKTRDFEPSDGANVCRTRRITVFPQTAYDHNQNLKFVVNTKEYRQEVTFEECIGSSECYGNNALFNYKTTCKQTYSTIRLLVVNSDNKIAFNNIPIPNSCVCTYKFVY